MKVLCKVSDGEPNPWLTVGNFYLVISVELNDGSLLFRLLGVDLPTPALFPANLFQIIDGRMPQNWQISLGKTSNSMSIEPSSWSKVGFWEEFFNGDDEAVKIFAREVAKMDMSEP